MDRKKEQVERYQYEFDARRDLDRRAARATARRSRRRRQRERGPIDSDHTPEEYMANVETVREGMRRGDYYEVVLRQTFSTPYSGKASDAVRARAAGQPEPLRVSAAIRRRATGGRVARDVRARRRAARRDLPDLRHGAAHRRSAARCRQHPRTAEVGEGRVRADDVHRRGPQRQVARLRAGHGEGDRAAADRIVRRRVPHRGSRGGIPARRASIRWMRSSATCGR